MAVAVQGRTLQLTYEAQSLTARRKVWVPEEGAGARALATCYHRYRNYKRVTGSIHTSTAEKLTSMHLHRPRATSQPDITVLTQLFSLAS